MNLYLNATGGQIPGDLLLECIVRSDLVPVPRTMEFTVRLKDDLESRLSKGASVWGGYEHLEYTIVKRERAQPSGVIQGGEAMQAMRFTAFLTKCKSIAEPRARPLTAMNTALGDLYRACGASVRIGNDFHVDRFAVLAGDVPSRAVAIALQEEGAALVLREGVLSVERLNNLMSQAPVDSLGQFDSTASHDSDLAEQHEIPMGASVNADGNIVGGDFSKARSARYIPGKDARTLYNLSHVLITRKVADSQLAQKIRAGDMVSVAGKNLLVITAAHRFLNSDGIIDTASRFWLGEIS